MGSKKKDLADEPAIYLYEFGTAYFDDELTSETIKELMEKLDELFTKYLRVKLYFSCIGGDLDSTEVFSDYIETNKNRIELVAAGQVASGGFHIFCMAKCKKKLLNSTIGMIHLPTRLIETREMHKKHSSSSVLIEYNKKLERQFIEEYSKLALHTHEMELLVSGEDVTIDPDRMKEIFP